MSDTGDEQALRPQLESWAADRVKVWGELQKDDYDFRNWAKDASKQLLQAGSVYEYARESRKLRCLLALMDPKRPREQSERNLPALIDGKRPGSDEIASLPSEGYFEPCCFEGLHEDHAGQALGGYLYCLRDLADYLVDNFSFGELFRTKREELEKAFGGLHELARVKGEFRYFLSVDVVELANQSEAELATVDETVCFTVFSARAKRRFSRSADRCGAGPSKDAAATDRSSNDRECVPQWLTAPRQDPSRRSTHK